MNKPIRSYKNTFLIAGKPVECEVKVFSDPELENFDDLTKHMQDDLREEMRGLVDSGRCELVYIRVEVSAAGCTGYDSIGGVFIMRNEDIDQCLVDHNMEYNAHEDLKNQMHSAFLKLQAVFHNE